MRIEHRSLRHCDGSVEIRLYFPEHAAWTSHDKPPARYLAYLALLAEGKLLVESRLGQAVAPEPFFSFRFDGVEPGSRLRIEWRNNRGEGGETEIELP